MLREAREHEELDFSVPDARHMPFDGDTYGDGDAEANDINEMNKREDEQYVAFFCPPIDQQLSQPGSSLTGRSIMEEITEMELDNTLPHFSTPVGRLPQRVRKPRARTAAQLTALRNERMNERQRALRSRQKHNDRVLESLIRRLF
jgi:hypothetical protein